MQPIILTLEDATGRRWVTAGEISSVLVAADDDSIKETLESLKEKGKIFITNVKVVTDAEGGF